VKHLESGAEVRRVLSFGWKLRITLK